MTWRGWSALAALVVLALVVAWNFYAHHVAGAASGVGGLVGWAIGWAISRRLLARRNGPAAPRVTWSPNTPRDLRDATGPYREPARATLRDKPEPAFSEAEIREMCAPAPAAAPAEEIRAHVVKRGPPLFSRRCTDCGSEFAYPFAATRPSHLYRLVDCPTCGRACIHVA